jgi:hypothetical protein
VLGVTIRPPFDPARECNDRALDLAGVAHIDRAQLHPERRRHRLERAQLPAPGGYRGIPKDGRSRHAWRNLLEQFQPFPAHAVFEQSKTGGIAARPRQALDEAGADRVDHIDEHDRDGVGRLFQRRHARAARRQNDVRRECDQFHGVSATAYGIVRAPAVVDPHVAASGPAQLLQSLQERRDAGLPFRIVRRCIYEHADVPHPAGLLRAHSERPRSRRAGEKGDELAPVHSITSSASCCR